MTVTMKKYYYDTVIFRKKEIVFALNKIFSLNKLDNIPKQEVLFSQNNI